MATSTSNTHWNKMTVLAVGDGTYIYTQIFGGFDGNKEFKLRALEATL